MISRLCSSTSQKAADDGGMGPAEETVDVNPESTGDVSPESTVEDVSPESTENVSQEVEELHTIIQDSEQVTGT